MATSVLFTGIKNNLKRNKYVKQYGDLVNFIIAGTASAAGCALAPEAEVQEIIKADPTMIEIVAGTTKDKNGNLTVRAKSVAPIDPAPSVPVAPSHEGKGENTTMFKLEAGVPLPTINRGGLKGDTYPFDAMEVGQSFFVQATTEKPTPAKSLASTVSSATKRYASKGGRQFTVRSVTEYRDANGNAVAAGTPDAIEVKGARVWRTADKVAAPAAAAVPATAATA